MNVDWFALPRIDAKTFTGRAMILSGVEAEEANRALHRRYGWQ